MIQKLIVLAVIVVVGFYLVSGIGVSPKIKNGIGYTISDRDKEREDRRVLNEPRHGEAIIEGLIGQSTKISPDEAELPASIPSSMRVRGLAGRSLYDE